MAGLLRRPLGDILRARSDARRAALREQIQEAIEALRHRGVVCEVIGSFARASAMVDAQSDLDILVESRGGLSETDVWDLAWTHLREVDADLVFAEHLSAQKVVLMKSMSRSDANFHACLLSRAAGLERATAALRDADAKQNRLKFTNPDAYDEAFHAAGLARLIQGIYTQTMSLLKQVIEQTDGKLPDCKVRHRDLICLAAVPTDDRVALINATAARSIQSLSDFSRVAGSNYVDDLDCARVLEHVPKATFAVAALVSGIRRVFEPPEIPNHFAAEWEA